MQCAQRLWSPPSDLPACPRHGCPLRLMGLVVTLAPTALSQGTYTVHLDTTRHRVRNNGEKNNASDCVPRGLEAFDNTASRCANAQRGVSTYAFKETRESCFLPLHRRHHASRHRAGGAAWALRRGIA